MAKTRKINENELLPDESGLTIESADNDAAQPAHAADTPAQETRHQEAQPVQIDIATLPCLYMGVTGRAAYVRMLQEQLATRGYPCAVTGVFDPITAQAVQRLQVAHKRVPDARVSLAEWQALTTEK